MGYEDFTTFTEVDVGADLITVVNATKCTGNAMTRVDTAYLYKDYGVDNFDDFEHLHDAKMTANSANINSYAGVWGISNTIGDIKDWATANFGICVFIWSPVVTLPRFMLYESDGTPTLDDSINFVKNTMYYLTTKRVDTTLTCKIYSDAARTVLLDTLTLAVHTRAYRYLFPISSYDTNTAGKSITFESLNLDLQSGETFDPTDDANASDAVTFNAGKNLTDDANASDANTFNAGINLADNAKASDANTFNVGENFTDNAKASDNISFQMFRAHNIGDTAKASDSLTFDAEINLDDIAKASDLYSDDSPPPPVYIYPCPTFTLHGTSTAILFPKPEWANPNNEISKNISLFNFKSGDLDTVDRGINTQLLIIGGTVCICLSVNWKTYATMTTWLDSIKNAMNNGERFTINELGDCLNGVYIIGDFVFNTLKGTSTGFTWSLSLERVKDI